MSEDCMPIWLREPAFMSELVAFTYGHSIDGSGWPDAEIVDNGGDPRTPAYEQKTYVPQRTCLMDSKGPDDAGGRGRLDHRFRCRACGHVFHYHAADGAAAVSAPAFCPECGAQVLRVVQPGDDAYQVVAANLRSMVSSCMAGADPLACIGRAVFGTEGVGDAGALLARLADLMDPAGIPPLAEEAGAEKSDIV